MWIRDVRITSCILWNSSFSVCLSLHQWITTTTRTAIYWFYCIIGLAAGSIYLLMDALERTHIQSFACCYHYYDYNALVAVLCALNRSQCENNNIARRLPATLCAENTSTTHKQHRTKAQDGRLAHEMECSEEEHIWSRAWEVNRRQRKVPMNFNALHPLFTRNKANTQIVCE